MKPTVKVIFDRKKKAEVSGVGNVEALVCLTRTEKTYVALDTMSLEAWYQCNPEKDYSDQLNLYQKAIRIMQENREEMCVHNFNKHINRESYQTQKEVKYKLFTDFMRDAIIKDNLKETTRHRKLLSLEKLLNFGRIQRFTDLTPENLKRFDDWLHDGTREDISIHTYHKHVKKYSRLAYELNYIQCDPYSKVHFSRGKCKERNPLSAEELDRLRTLNLNGHLERARDLFIFAAYTGLSFCDMEEFDFNTMTEEIEGMYYIDGRRIKTDTNFFTPILPYAMDVLKKYNYMLPLMSNQKVNDFLKVLAAMAYINKKLSFHIARHSFATQALAHDIPIDKVARMLGHKEIRTTQIYAKVLKESITNHSANWAESLSKGDKHDSRPKPKREKKKLEDNAASQSIPQPVVPQPISQPSTEYYYPESYTSVSYTYV